MLEWKINIRIYLDYWESKTCLNGKLILEYISIIGRVKHA